MKTCTKCLKEKKEDCFGKSKKGAGGLRSICRECHNKNTKEWQKNNPEKVRAYCVLWRLANPERRIENGRRQYKNNRENRIVSTKKWQKANSETYKKYEKKYEKNNRIKINDARRRRYKNNPEKVNERNRRYYRAHPEKAKETSAKWRKNNMEKRSVANQNRRARKNKNGGVVTQREWENLLDYYNKTCLCCGRKDVKLTMDHVNPIKLGGAHVIENIQPLCASCNSSKNAKLIDYRTSKIVK